MLAAPAFLALPLPTRLCPHAARRDRRPHGQSSTENLRLLAARAHASVARSALSLPHTHPLRGRPIRLVVHVGWSSRQGRGRLDSGRGFRRGSDFLSRMSADAATAAVLDAVLPFAAAAAIRLPIATRANLLSLAAPRAAVSATSNAAAHVAPSTDPAADASASIAASRAAAASSNRLPAERRPQCASNA